MHPITFSRDLAQIQPLQLGTSEATGFKVTDDSETVFWRGIIDPSTMSPKPLNSIVTLRRALRVLLVEYSEPDAMLLKHTLQRGGFEVSSERVDTPENMARSLEKQTW